MRRFKAIYATTGLKNWIDVAKRLYENHNIYPEYWITHDLKNEVEDAFRDTITHDEHDAIEGRFPYKSDSGPLYEPLNAEILRELSTHESIALEMMNREDRKNKTKVSYPYQERIADYQTQVSYWLSVVKELEPDVVIFGTTPHLVYDYILYAVCDYLGIQTILFTHTGLPDRFIAKSSISQDPIREVDLETEKDISDTSYGYIEKVRSDYGTAEPEYLKSSLKNNFISKIGNAKEMYQDFFTYVARRIEEPEKTDYGILVKIKNGVFTVVYPRYYKKKLSRAYKNNTGDIDLSSDYIYFPLHYQPERSTSPEGGYYTHQEIAIKMISSAIPSRYSIYVKEHPSQFRPDLNGEQGRLGNYYKKLNKIAGVELVPIKTNPFSLIDNAKAVATITGTAGWEALIRGTPSIVFGNAWYRSAENCYHPVDSKEVRESLNQIIKDNQGQNDNIKRFVSAVESVSYKGDLNSEMNENVQSFYRAVCDKMNLE